MKMMTRSPEPTVNGLVKPDSKAGHKERLAEYLAALAGLSGGVAALAGFIPGLYRDPKRIVEQSHGYDLGNLVVVVVLEIAVLWSMRGSVRARLVALGALGCLFYSFVTYAFVIVLNPATVLYIAVLGFGGWSFVAGIARVDDTEVEALLSGRLPRRVTAGFLVVLALLFGANWLSQMAGAAVSGNLPPDLAASGWPMNPVYVLDLGFVVPLALIVAARLALGRPGATRLAVPFLVFDALLAVTILLMALTATAVGQPLDAPMVAIFATDAIVASTLSARALLPFHMSRRRGRELGVALTEGSGTST